MRSVLANPSIDLAGDPDAVALSLWHTWWPQFGLLKPDAIAISAYSGAPFLSNHLGFMPIFQSFVFGLLTPLIDNPILDLNIILFASHLGSHYATYRFIRSKIKSQIAALAMSTAVVLTPWYSAGVGRSDIIAIGQWWLPMNLLLWDKWLRTLNVRWAVLLIAGLYGAVLAGMQNTAGLLTLWLPYAVWTGRKVHNSLSSHSRERTHLQDQLTLIGLSIGVLLLIYPMPNILRTLQGGEPDFAAQSFISVPSSVVSTLFRTAPLIWLLALARLSTSRQVRSEINWLLLCFANLTFALRLIPDPIAMVAGALALPYQPLFSPDTFFAPAILSAAIVGSRITTWHHPTRGEQRVVPQSSWGILLVIAYILSLVDSSRIESTVRVTDESTHYYASIASEPEDYMILEYPFGLHSLQDGRSLGTQAQRVLYAPWHHKRTLSGVSYYYEPIVFDNFSLMSFLFPDELEHDEYESAAVALRHSINTWRIGYVFVQRDALSDASMQNVIRIVEMSGAVCEGVQVDNQMIFRAKWHPAEC